MMMTTMLYKCMMFNYGVLARAGDHPDTEYSYPMMEHRALLVPTFGSFSSSGVARLISVWQETRTGNFTCNEHRDYDKAVL